MTIINLIMKLYKYRGKDARGKYHCPTFTAIFMIFHCFVYFCLRRVILYELNRRMKKGHEISFTPIN